MGVVATIVILVIGWYKWPVRLTKVETSEVGVIVLQDGDTGNRVEISDGETIDRLMKEFRSVKIQRKGLSAFSGGYHIWVRVCKPDMDVAYLEQLIAEAQDTEE